MEMNFLAILLAAVSTLAVGFIWYNPKVFGTIWMKETGINPEEGEKPNMILIFGLSVLYAFFIAFLLQAITIHQFSALGVVGGDDKNESFKIFMSAVNTNGVANGDAFRTFGHGALHGVLTGLFIILPVTGTNALYEKRSFKYVMVTSGFWIVCFAIMGGIVCAMK